MVSLVDLWLPILVSAAAVFIASALVWMVLPHHKKDWKGLSNEDDVAAKIRDGGVSPGQYSIPFCTDMKDMEKPEIKEKLAKGPVAYITIAPNGPPNMGKNLLLTFIYYVVVSIFVAYIAGHCLPGGEDYLAVFRVCGTVAFMAYAGAIPCYSIWFSKPWSTSFKDMLDGLIYALITAGFFGWLWPGAAA